MRREVEGVLRVGQDPDRPGPAHVTRGLIAQGAEHSRGLVQGPVEGVGVG